MDREAQLETSIESHSSNSEQSLLSSIENKTDIRVVTGLENVSRLESATYDLFLKGYTSELLSEVVAVMTHYSNLEEKELNLKMSKTLQSGLAALENAKPSMEDVRRMLDESYSIENSLVQKMQIFVSKVKSSFAIFDNDLNVVYTQDKSVGDFVKEILKPSDRAPVPMGKYVQMMVNTTKNALAPKNKQDRDTSLYGIMESTPCPFNLFLIREQSDTMREDLTKRAETMKTTSNGFKSKVSFPTRILTRDPNSALLDLSPQIMGILKDDLLHPNLMQFQFDTSVPRRPIVYDGLVTAFVSDDGKVGDIPTCLAFGDSYNFPEYKLSAIDVSSLDTISNSRQALIKKIKDRGMVRLNKQKGLYAIRVEWKRKLVISDLVAGNRLGVTDFATVDQVYSLRDKGKMLNGGENPSKILKNNIFLLIDGMSGFLLVLPKRFLRKDSTLRTTDPQLGMPYSKSLSRNVAAFRSAFFLGVMMQPDILTVTTDDIIATSGFFKRFRNQLNDSKYRTYVEKMVDVMDRIKPRIVLRRGKSDLPDPDVTEYFENQGWVAEEHSSSDSELEFSEDDDFSFEAVGFSSSEDDNLPIQVITPADVADGDGNTAIGSSSREEDEEIVGAQSDEIDE